VVAATPGRVDAQVAPEVQKRPVAAAATGCASVAVHGSTAPVAGFAMLGLMVFATRRRRR